MSKKSFHGYMGIQIVELREDDIKIMLHSGFNSIIVLIRLLTKSMNKLEVKFSDIQSIRQGKSIFDDRAFKIIYKDKNGNSIKKQTLLHLLSKNDRKIIFQFLETKNVEIKVR